MAKDMMLLVFLMTTTCFIMKTPAAGAVVATPTAIATAAAADSPWERGTYGVLSFAAGAKAFTWTYGGDGGSGDIVMTSTPGSLDNSTGFHTNNGTDRTFGPYDELALTFGDSGELAVRYLPRMDAFIFLRRPIAAAPTTTAAGVSPSTAPLPTKWPSLSVAQVAPNTTRCLSWAEHYFFPGTVGPRVAHTNPQPPGLWECGGGGPLFFFANTSSGSAISPSMALSPLSHFTSNKVASPGHDLTGMGVDAAAGHCGGSAKCLQFQTAAALLARPGITRVTRAFGSLLRQAQNTTRRRGAGVNQLSFWNDNQAAYSWWTVGHDQTVWGLPEDIYLTLKKRYDEAEIPIRGWEPDNNIDADFHGTWDSTAKNWIGHDYTKWNTTLYPSDGPEFVRKLGNLSMVYYTNGFGGDNVHAKANGGPWNFVKKGNEPHPNVSYAFYKSIFGNAAAKWNMKMLFTDFLCYRGPTMGQYQDCGDDEEAESKWLAGMTQAAMDTGSEIQYCMALASQILLSTEHPGVTNARVNGDGGLDVAHLTLPALLASIVGLGWSKDNLRTADKCYVPALWANGSVKWPCGSINQREGTSGKYMQQKQQTILATLSLGPVGISDQLTERPTMLPPSSRVPNPNAKISSNKDLVMATCAATGDLLQPSYPLAPLDKMLTGFTNGDAPFFSLWGTYTAVPAQDGSVNLWYLAYCFGTAGKHKPGAQVILEESDLAVMVDAAALPAPSFGAIPTGAFTGEGAQFPNASGVSAHVVWKSNWHPAGDPDDDIAEGGCDAVKPALWTANGFPMTLADDITNIAPMWGDKALLGEQTKIVAMSSYRFSSVNGTASSIVVGLRGLSGEKVTLLLATRAGAEVTCSTHVATIGASGTATVTL